MYLYKTPNKHICSVRFCSGAYSIAGVFVVHSKVTLTFRKIELKSIL